MERGKNVGGLKKREMRNKIIGFDFCVSHEKERKEKKLFLVSSTCPVSILQKVF